MIPAPSYLRTRGIKPPGGPRINWSRAPRGLDFCLSMGGPDFVDIVRGRRPTVTNSPRLAGSHRGSAYDANSNGILGYSFTAAPQVFSFEVLVIAGSAVSGTNEAIFGFNQAADGGNGIFDRVVYGGSGGNYSFYIYDGSPQFNSSSNTFFTNNTLTHIVATCNSGTKIYENGVLSNTLGTGAPYSGYANPAYLVVGRNQRNGIGQLGSTTSRLLIANMATVEWTADEIKARAADPFGFLEYPTDAAFRMLKGAAASLIYNRRTLGQRTGTRAA